MCIEDIAISRRCYTKETTFGADTNISIPTNPYRLGVTLEVILNGYTTATISQTEADATALRGFVSSYKNTAGVSEAAATLDLTATYLTHPGIIHEELWFRVNGGAGKITEILAEESLMKAIRKRLDEIGK